MILIISQSHNEPSTDNVIDWIDYLNMSVKRINGIDFYKNLEINIDNEKSYLKIKNIPLEKIKVIWFRRWITRENVKDIFIENKQSDRLRQRINTFLKNEFNELASFFFEWIPKEILFERIFDKDINKLSVIYKASELGLEIPKTFIGTKKNDFKELLKKQKLIVKAISNAPTFDVDNETFVGYTEKIKKIPSELGDFFAPSLVQNLIEKKYEIRAFLLNNTFYSMAIFSQKDKQTSLDFRKYNWDNPNKMTAFKLPASIEDKLLKLAKHFQLNTCSFDLIKTIDNRYIFLEVNPGGQFGMVSHPCNYFLEKKIAEKLIQRCN
ncbi:MAG: grasp-with-spasm system ATP-grasp peptide maturase [Patiriisocius sp.]|uniref:grasp-with-spasm system ATP-grasp peptide maturase n=1 Tax=Patiriisocius sp. TaxID=2822396 RepID=UPI003EF58386